MALRWAWDFGLGIPTSFYENSSDWGVTGGSTRVITDNTTNLASPSGPGTPGEQFNCHIVQTLTTVELFTPDVTALGATGQVVSGWYNARWRIVGTIESASNVNILKLNEVNTTRVHLRGDVDGNPVPLELFVNGTSVGTTTSLIGDADSYVLAIDFDMAAVPPEAGLVVDGVREIARGPGSGTATGLTRAVLGSGSTVAGAPNGGFHGVQLFFDSLLDDGGNANYWGTGLNADSLIDGDVSWSIFGGAGSKMAAVSDRVATTGIDTTTDPDSVTVGFQDTTDILAGWLPGTILMVIGWAVGSADVIDQATLTLSDGVGVAGTTTETLVAVQHFVTAYSTLNSVAGAWTAAQVNLATYDYDVST